MHTELALEKCTTCLTAHTAAGGALLITHDPAQRLVNQEVDFYCRKEITITTIFKDNELYTSTQTQATLTSLSQSQ